MEKEGKYTKVLKVRIDPELLDQVKDETKRLDIDVSTYVRWCIRTGLYLKDLNSFLKSKGIEEEWNKLWDQNRENGTVKWNRIPNTLKLSYEKYKY